MCSEPLTLRLGAILVPLLWSFDVLWSGHLWFVLVSPWICCFYLLLICVVLKLKAKVTLRLTVSQSVSLGIEPHLGPMTRYLFLSDNYVLVSVGRPLWREDGSVFCMCRWPLRAQPFSGPSPLGLATVFYCLRFETSLFFGSYDPASTRVCWSLLGSATFISYSRADWKTPSWRVTFPVLALLRISTIRLPRNS
jgi:hypothetical protein